LCTLYIKSDDLMKVLAAAAWVLAVFLQGYKSVSDRLCGLQLGYIGLFSVPSGLYGPGSCSHYRGLVGARGVPVMLIVTQVILHK
jgi:hypothetical protein